MVSATPARSPTWSRARREKARTRSRSVRRTACLPPIPRHFGPYSPSSRLFLNPLFADPTLVLGAARVAVAHDRRERHDGTLIDWPVAARAKYALLRRLFDDFVTNGGPSTADFESFVRDGGDRLREHALFEALHQHWFGSPEPKWRWNDWPDEWRAPTAPALARFAAAESQAIRFHLFLQWIAARSFAHVQQDARDAGMRIGLIADLAIGMNPGGSHAWSRQQDLLLGLNVGAPPDQFNTRGQDWGLTGFSPQALLANGFEPFIATLRAAMTHAGGVRIDHAMGLARLWLVPARRVRQGRRLSRVSGRRLDAAFSRSSRTAIVRW